MELLSKLIFSYGLTIIIELMVIGILYKKNNRLIFISLILNFCTNVPLNLSLYLLNFLTGYLWWIVVIIFEILVFLIEGFFYSRLYFNDYKKGFSLSFIANICSLMFGFVVQYLILLVK